MVVDDAPFIRELLKEILSSLGGQCVGEGENGSQGLELVKRTLPDVMMLDLVMPDKNGLDSIKSSLEIWPEVKIVVCSTLDQDPIIDRALKLGARAYVSKPFSQEKLKEKLLDLGVI